MESPIFCYLHCVKILGRFPTLSLSQFCLFQFSKFFPFQPINHQHSYSNACIVHLFVFLIYPELKYSILSLTDTPKFCVKIFVTFPIEIRPFFGLCQNFYFHQQVSKDEFMKDGITYFLLFTLCEDRRTIPYPFSLSFAYFSLANFSLFSLSIINTRTQMRVQSTYLYF